MNWLNEIEKERLKEGRVVCGWPLLLWVMGGAARQCSANKREQREKKDKSIEFNIISVFS